MQKIVEDSFVVEKLSPAEELRRVEQAAEEIKERVAGNKEAARQVLYEAGIITKKGKLRAVYKD